MKLHAFDAVVHGTRLRGFTRDRAGIRLLRHMTVSSLGLSIKPDDWKYSGEIAFNKKDGLFAQIVLRQVRTSGFCVTPLRELPATFYVFDVEMDFGRLRVFSIDRDSTEFRNAMRRAQLGAKGELFQGVNETFVDEIQIDSKEQATAMGISDLEDLLHRGYSFVTTRTASAIEMLERQILRNLKEEMD